MPLTANQGVACNVSDCFIISSGITFFFLKGAFQNTLKNRHQESFDSIIHNQFSFWKGKPNIWKNRTDFFEQRKILLLLVVLLSYFNRKTRKIATLIKFELKNSEKDLKIYLLVTLFLRA